MAAVDLHRSSLRKTHLSPIILNPATAVLRPLLIITAARVLDATYIQASSPDVSLLLQSVLVLLDDFLEFLPRCFVHDLLVYLLDDAVGDLAAFHCLEHLLGSVLVCNQFAALEQLRLGVHEILVLRQQEVLELTDIVGA